MKRIVLAACLVACASEKKAAPTPAQASQTAAAEAPAAPRNPWQPLVDAADRTPEDKALDPGRHPAEMLEFLNLKPGMKVAELGAGGGYTTELMARAVGPQGVVYLQNPPAWAKGFARAAIEKRLQSPADRNVVRVDRPFDDPLPPEAKNLDAVVTNAIYHDIANTPVDRVRLLRVLFNALQPGGALVIIDSSAKPGTGTEATRTLHRIDEAVVRDEAQKAGFKLVQEGSFLRNPQDPRDWNASPGAAGARRGTSDRFALRFVRPEGSAQQTVAPALRLPEGYRPERVSATLTVDPARDTLDGEETLSLTVQENAPATLWLNADGITIQQVEPAAQIVDAQPGFVGLTFAQPLGAGAHDVRIRFRSRVSATDTDGAFRQQENGAWYVITHLEPTGARRILPCFDEPSWKIPWTIALRVPAGAAAYFNTNVQSQEWQGEQKLVRFQTTKPLPSYLLAFGVGPYERVAAGKMKSGPPVGIVVTKGKKAWATYSAQSSPRLMNLLEQWFQIDYHYPKLDLIEVPLGTGAMENPGLITFNQRVNLARPGEETPQFHRRAAAVEAHEFAHLWFGDLVTTAWWNDIWLNEAFATWMSAKILETFEPRWDAPAERAQSLFQAMGEDSLLSARQIRQPVTSEGDIKTAFDAITYNKGAAVIGMFEHYVGAGKFRAGVQSYLRAHADGNATAAEFLAAISQAAGQDVAKPFSTFLDQAGLPLLSAQVSCAGKGATVQLAQSRYLPLGAKPPAPQTWEIPVCVKYAAGGKTETTCTLLAQASGTLELPACPDWLLPNAEALGYYRTALDEGALGALQKARLSVPERMLLLNDARAAARAGKLAMPQLIAVAQQSAGDADRHVVQGAQAAVSGYRSMGLVYETEAPKWAAFLGATFGARARALGVTAKKGESEDARFLREGLVRLVADEAEDPALQADARRVAAAWLANHASAPPDSAALALDVAASHGDAALFDRLLAAARAEKNRVDRALILHALGLFRDPALRGRALQLALSNDFDAREATPLIFGALATPAGRADALEFVDRSYDALVQRLPRDFGGVLTSAIAGSLCDDAQLDRATQAFAARAAKTAGGERRFAQATESARDCAAFRKKAQPELAAWLSAR